MKMKEDKLEIYLSKISQQYFQAEDKFPKWSITIAKNLQTLTIP